MRFLGPLVVFFWLLSWGTLASYAQPMKGPCGILAKADVERATDLTFDQAGVPLFQAPPAAPHTTFSECYFYDSRAGAVAWYSLGRTWRGVMVSLVAYVAENSDAFMEEARSSKMLAADGMLLPGSVEEGIGDAAFWTRDQDCALYAFSRGSITLKIRINGLRDPNEAACRQAVRTLAIKTLRGTGKTGYRYYGFATAPPAVQPNGKTACELIAKADVESIVGYALLAPRPEPVSEINDNFEFKGIASASGCVFDPSQPRPDATNAYVLLEVRYLRQAAACPDRDEVIHARASAATYLRMLKEYKGTFPYPAAWIDTRDSLLALKEDAGGTKALLVQIQWGTYYYTHPRPAEAFADKLNRTQSLALKILGTPPKRLDQCESDNPPATSSAPPKNNGRAPEWRCTWRQETVWVPGKPGSTDHGHQESRIGCQWGWVY